MGNHLDSKVEQYTNYKSTTYTHACECVLVCVSVRPSGMYVCVHHIYILL